MVELNAVPSSGYNFEGWSGDLNGNTNPSMIKMECAKKVTAKFSRRLRTITITASEGGTTDPAPGKHSFPEGDTVSLAALPQAGWRFAGWAGEVSATTGDRTEITIDKDKTIGVDFSPIMHSIKIEVNGWGSTIPAPGIYTFQEGTTVSLTAKPCIGWDFARWEQSVSDPKLITINMPVSADKTVTDYFEINRWIIVSIMGGIVIAGLIAYLMYC
jgi:hypothetical protein